MTPTVLRPLAPLLSLAFLLFACSEAQFVLPEKPVPAAPSPTPKPVAKPQRVEKQLEFPYGHIYGLAHIHFEIIPTNTFRNTVLNNILAQVPKFVEILADKTAGEADAIYFSVNMGQFGDWFLDRTTNTPYQIRESMRALYNDGDSFGSEVYWLLESSLNSGPQGANYYPIIWRDIEMADYLKDSVVAQRKKFFDSGLNYHKKKIRSPFPIAHSYFRTTDDCNVLPFSLAPRFRRLYPFTHRDLCAFRSDSSVVQEEFRLATVAKNIREIQSRRYLSCKPIEGSVNVFLNGQMLLPSQYKVHGDLRVEIPTAQLGDKVRVEYACLEKV